MTGSKIWFCGDTHGCFDHLLEAAQAHQPAAIILLGDIQSDLPLHQQLSELAELTQVWFIHGNHDTGSVNHYDNVFSGPWAGRNLHGRVVEIAGKRIAGWGGVFRGQVWFPPTPWRFVNPEALLAKLPDRDHWRNGLPLKHRSTIFPSEIAKLATEKADILVTHEAPSAHPHGFAVLDELAQYLGVKQSFHGHHHDSLDYQAEWPRLGFQAFGVGFRGITDEQGLRIREGD